ncbi:uncharacterized protein [Dermacentor andersoni]|uniref:uncharacterized protein isoform X2 n=1 Tax=Dermacentor andersoni TaxID=34620 RepID=UPI0024170AF8|nr:uncharacterized protein LOC126538853 isoform X2 [Dermacentor andersoni]
MRAATDIMLSCKDYIMKLDLSPLILKERRRLCIAIRICYAQASYHNSELLARLRLNVTTLVKAGTTCAFNYIPREEKYALAILAYFSDFISG